MRASSILLLLPALVLCLATPSGEAAHRATGQDQPGPEGPERILVLDGSNVHNVGNFNVHVGNWGLFGSWPGTANMFSAAPSGEWPAGSGVEYIFGAGLWVGALVNGVPSVSTAVYESEFRPTQSPIDIIYRSSEGAPNGKRVPDPNADDDNDGLVDEDWLDAHDNDGDGWIDEDYAAISDQMFSCWYTDDQPAATQIYPQHRPIHLLVRQESYQWENSRFDDAIAIDYTITNTGTNVAEHIYVGFFMDPDCGNRNTPNYYQDDATRFSSLARVCTDIGSTPLQMAYAFDADEDGGQTPGRIAVVLIDHTTDPTGVDAPSQVGVSTYANFNGNAPFESGGQPTNDFERYEVLSSETIGRNSDVPRDISFLVSVGPFRELQPGESLKFTIALAMGSNSLGPIGNAASAKLLYKGNFYDVDGDPGTGVLGRETRVVGPAQDVVIDPCDPPFDQPFDLGEGDTVWINTDCVEENNGRLVCGYDPSQEALYRTGIHGRETQAHWTLPTGGTVPTLISGFDARVIEGGVLLEWSIYSDDVIEGFRIYRRADGGPELLVGNQPIAPDLRLFEDRTTEPNQTYAYTLVVVLDDGSELRSATAPITTLAASLALHQNKPNPFNPATTISFTLPNQVAARVSIHDVQGKLVRSLVDDELSHGIHRYVWDGRDDRGAQVSTGVYFYRLHAGNQMLTRKMLLLK